MKKNILFLAQRIPFPPDKGDKITTFNILRELGKDNRVFVAAFADDQDDMKHIAALRELCEDLLIRPLIPKMAKLRSLPGLLQNKSLTEGYFKDHSMQRWVDEVIAKRSIDAVFVYSSAMSQYISLEVANKLPCVAHYADIDSDKWLQYSRMHHGIMKWIYAREARTLLSFERQHGARMRAVCFVTDHEADLFKSLAPELAQRIEVLENGVDTSYFSPALEHANPFATDELPVVFTGAMDYFPNADAVTWFANEILPAVREKRPSARFYIVGSKPGAEVLALGKRDGIVVTGRVPDVRPFLKYARSVVIPLRAARGVQNKALEALAMGQPVLCTSAVARGLKSMSRSVTQIADEAQDFSSVVINAISSTVDSQKAAECRNAILDEYSWQANLAPLRRLLALAPQ